MASRKQKSRNAKNTCNLTHNEQLEEAFDTSSSDYIKMMNIIRTSNKDKEPLHKHHIVPRSWFVHNNYAVDNTDDNIAYITPFEHCMVHYYAWKCAKKVIKRSMCMAFHLMCNTAQKGLKDIPFIAREYQRAIIDSSASIQSVNTRLSKLHSTFICKTVKDKILFHCQECGYEKYVSRSWHKQEAICPTCKFKSTRRYYGKYALVMAILPDGHAYYLTSEELPTNKHKCHSWSKLNTFASRMINAHKDRIKKWKLIGATDKQFRWPYIPYWDKETLERFVYWYKVDKSMCRYIIISFNDKKTFNRILKACEHYNIDVNFIYEEMKSNSPHIYYIDEFDESHFIKEWEYILGNCWITIRNKYNVEDWGMFNAGEIFDKLLSLVRDTHSLEAVDRLYAEVRREAILNGYISEDDTN